MGQASLSGFNFNNGGATLRYKNSNAMERMEDLFDGALFSYGANKYFKTKTTKVSILGESNICSTFRINETIDGKTSKKCVNATKSQSKSTSTSISQDCAGTRVAAPILSSSSSSAAAAPSSVAQRVSTAVSPSSEKSDQDIDVMMM